MASSQNPQDDCDHLRSEILILSSYFSNQQSRSSESHREDHDWPLCADISTLLTIGNDDSPEAKIVNAVAGKINDHGIEHLICVENAFQNYGQVRALKADLKNGGGGKMDVRVDRAGSNALGRSDTKRCQTGRTDRAQMMTGNERDAYLVSITPIKEKGQILLTQWNEERRVAEIASVKKFVLYRCFRTHISHSLCTQ